MILLEKALITYLDKTYPNEKDDFLNELKKKRGTAGKREIIIKRLHSKIKNIIPNEEPNRLLKFLEFTFALIAETRNEAGHPIGVEISADESAHLLWQFKIIAPKIRNLIINMDSEETWSGK